MSNMSYCRWNNTLLDLRDCVDNMQWWLEDNDGKTVQDYRNTLSADEAVSFDRLMVLAKEILGLAEDYSQEQEEEEFDVDS